MSHKALCSLFLGCHKIARPTQHQQWPTLGIGATRMKITLTNDDGTVFVHHQVNREVAHWLEYIFMYDTVPPESMSGNAKANEIVLDLKTALRRTAIDGDIM